MLYLALIALLSLGVAVIVRDSAVSIGAVLALLYLFPIVLAFIGNEHWQHRLERWTPTVAGLTIQDTTGLRSLAITPWAGLGVLAIWAGAALLAGGLVFRLPRRLAGRGAVQTGLVPVISNQAEAPYVLPPRGWLRRTPSSSGRKRPCPGPPALSSCTAPP